MPDQPRVNENRFYGYPIGRVVAVLDDGDALQSALGSLARAGVNVTATNVLTGAEGGHLLDRGGRRHGLWGRVTRLVQRGAYENETLTAHEAALRGCDRQR